MKTIQTDRNMIYAYHGPNVTNRFCDFFVVVGRGGKSLIMEGKQAFQLTSVILLTSDSLIMGPKWVCGVLRQWLWSNSPPKKTKQKNPQMDPFQTHVWTPTQQWFNVWRCCVLLSYPPLVIPLQYQVWLKVSQKLRLWGWQWGFQLGVRKGCKDNFYRKPPLHTNVLAVSERDVQDSLQLWLSFLGKDEEETFKQLFSFEDPFLLNNPATRLDLSSFFFLKA